MAKVKADGTGLVYCGYIGGDSSDYANGIVVDKTGNAYVGGQTSSTETTFPVKTGPDLTYNGSNYDAYVAKVRADGTGLVYCGYIGASGDSGPGQPTDKGIGIAVDQSGIAYVCGFTYSGETTFPVIIGPDLTYNGSGDAFVAKVRLITHVPLDLLLLE
jgi:hypothetical protein